MENYVTWNHGDIFSIKMVGTCEWIRFHLATLADDFLEPKFGYTGELFDEN